MLRSCSGALGAKEYWQASPGVGSALRCGNASRFKFAVHRTVAQLGGRVGYAGRQGFGSCLGLCQVAGLFAAVTWAAVAGAAGGSWSSSSILGSPASVSPIAVTRPLWLELQFSLCASDRTSA